MAWPESWQRAGSGWESRRHGYHPASVSARPFTILLPAARSGCC